MRYIPSTCTIAIETELGSVYHTPENSPTFIAVAFEPKATRNHTWLYKFASYQQMQDHIQKFFDNRKRHQENKAERKAEAEAFDASIIYPVGTIIYNSWGWEQTNIDYYQVVKTSKAFVFLQPIKQEVTEYYRNDSELVKPIPNSFYSDVITKHKANKDHINFTHGGGYRYAGGTQYQSHYA